MSSLLNVSPGITPRFFSQKMAANDPEKKIPSTAANATRRSAYGEFWSSIQRNAHSAFFFTHGMVSIALNSFSLPGHKNMPKLAQDVDYCNAIYAGALKIITEKSQQVPNAATQVFSDTWKSDRGLTLMHDKLHWLNMPENDNLYKFTFYLLTYLQKIHLPVQQMTKMITHYFAHTVGALLLVFIG